MKLLKNLAVLGLVGAASLSSVANAQTCSIEFAPGAVIAAETTADFLVIPQGCQIDADGTAEQPIIFTHVDDPVAGGSGIEDNARGLWGGIVINGFAPINDCPEDVRGTAQCTKEGEANSGTFGGANPNDDSGTLRYVVVKYAGSAVDTENELNGIAFQGVGSGTEVEYIQVHNNFDDGVEFFGGTVSVRYLVLTGNGDDSLDWTDGWTGNLQYVYIEQTDSGDNGIEADNREEGENNLPRSNPTIANMSIFGKSDENGIRLRRGTGLALYNSLVNDSATCLRIEGDVSRNGLGDLITVEGTTFGCVATHRGDDDGAVANYLATESSVSVDGGQVSPVALPSDNFFDIAGENQIGAFGTTNWADGWTVAGSVSNPSPPDFGCPSGTTAAGTINGIRNCLLSGTLTSDVSLFNTNVYQLSGKVVVGNDNADSAVLSIQAGTTIYGATTADFLVISRGSRIEALGTQTSPITFTSDDDVNGLISDDVSGDRGQWGGLVINGNASINDCPEDVRQTAQCTKEGEANSGTFGGVTDDDNSGTLRYVVVKFAGSAVDTENELNGIAFQGVGSGTTVEYIQVHNNFDDGVEFFGGTVNAKFVVLTGNGDDSLDWTDGWRGSLQFVIIQQAPGFGDQGIEADSREEGENNLPRSNPRIANMSLSGNSGENAIRLRRGTGLKLFNTIVNGSDTCLRVDGDISRGFLGSEIVVANTSLGCEISPVTGDGDNAIINYLNSADSVSTGGQSVVANALDNDPFFMPVNFIGAFDGAANDWTAMWTVGNPGGTVASFACPTGTVETDPIAGIRTCQISGTIIGDLTLTRGSLYVLNGRVEVGSDSGGASPAIQAGNLTIESGTFIIGDDAEDFLVVSRGSTINAMGSQFAPIVFTARTDITGTIAQDAVGQWGGLVINGFARINDCPEDVRGTAACVKEGEANSGTFGGDNDLDSSGTLKYVQVRYAGSAVDTENELNGIAFQAVGRNTEVDFIQVHNNFDDGVEFFGGTVDVKHVVLTGNGDDSMDWTDGWTGRAQFVHIVQDPARGDNGIEADNREEGENNLPRSSPTIVNMTIEGRVEDNSIRLRRGTGLDLRNADLFGSATCLRVEGTSRDLLGSDIQIGGTRLACTATHRGDDDGAVASYLSGADNVSTDGSSVQPVAAPDDGFFDPSTVIGSDVDNWSEGWTFGL